jgi:hypothetical protein
MFGRVPSAVTRLFPINRIDKVCLAFGTLVLVLCSVLWLLLLVVAGTGPLHLAEACLAWAAKTEMLIVLPAWIVARLAYSLYEIMGHSRTLHPAIRRFGHSPR